MNFNYFIVLIQLYKIEYNKKPLYIQTLKGQTKQGFVKTVKKYYCDLMFDKNAETLVNWFENLEERCRKLIYEKRDAWFQNSLEENDIDTVNFSYLLKVQESYQVLTKVFIHELKKHPRPYELTYVVLRGESHLLEDRLLGFYVASQPALNDQLLLTSENLSTHPPQSLAF